MPHQAGTQEGCLAASKSQNRGSTIVCTATQPPTTTPLFLQVAVGKREYSGNIEHDDLSFPVTSLRESMVITLYNADRELISKAELNTKAIIESGTMDVTFTLDSGGKIILQLQFLLNDDDRRRIQEMRNSAMKRKQQELLGDGYELNFTDIPLSRQLIEKISNIGSKGDQPKLRKSMSLDDLQERAIYSGINVDPRMKASRDLLLQSRGINTSKFEDSSGSKKRHGKPPESRSSSSVKKMISAFEGTSSQGTLSSETGASLTASGRTETGKVIVPLGDKALNYRSNAPGQSGLSNAHESRSRRSSSRDGASKQKMREHDMSRSKRRSQVKHRGSIGPYSSEQMRWRDYLQRPLNYVIATSSTWMHPHVCVTTASRQLKDLLEREHLNSLTYVEDGDKSLLVGEDIVESTSEDESIAQSGGGGGGGFPVLNLNGWLINQGVRAAIVIIACGAMFLNNR